MLTGNSRTPPLGSCWTTASARGVVFLSSDEVRVWACEGSDSIVASRTPGSAKFRNRITCCEPSSIRIFRMNVKDKAPEFSLPDENGNPVELKQFRGNPVVLFFYPNADTPG